MYTFPNLRGFEYGSLPFFISLGLGSFTRTLDRVCVSIGGDAEGHS